MIASILSILSSIFGMIGAKFLQNIINGYIQKYQNYKDKKDLAEVVEGQHNDAQAIQKQVDEQAKLEDEWNKTH